MGLADAKSINIFVSASGPYAAQMGQMGAATATFGNQASAGMAKAQVATSRFGAAASKVAKGGALVVIAILLASAKAAITFESSFAGVRKTVDATEGGFRRLAEGLREMAREMPIASGELAKIMELGGQLGVEPGNLLEFTETIAMIGVTTNLAADEAAMGFARIDNIMQLGGGSFDNMGSSIVDLGNNFAATEDEIMNFTLRIAPIGATVGSTTDEILGIATAFTSVGIPAERGGTAIQKTFISIAEAAKNGGEELDTFASTAGMTIDEFARLATTDPTAAFQAFVNGLGDIEAAGGNTFQVLDSVHLGNQRVITSLLGMASAEGVLDDALLLANESWIDNIALTEEAEKRFGTTASQLTTVKNKILDIGIGIGNELIPLVGDFAQGLSVLLDGLIGLFSGLTDWSKKLSLALSALLALATLAMTGHPVIAGLILVAGGIAAIGMAAKRAEDRTEALRDAVDSLSTLNPGVDLPTLIGDRNIDMLIGMGFTKADIDKAVLGSQSEFNDFVGLVQTGIYAGLSDENKSIVANIGFDAAFGTGDPGSPGQFADAGNGVIASVAKVRRDIDNEIGNMTSEQSDINLARLYGIELPGFADQDRARSDARAMVRSLYSGVNEETESAFNEYATIPDKYLDQAGDAVGEYADTVAEAMSEVDSNIRGQISGWYEFDDELEIVVDDIIATLQRQITAIGDFNTEVAGLSLSPDVESLLRSDFDSPALKEGFLGLTEADKLKLIAGYEDAAKRINTAVKEQQMRDLPVVEFTAGIDLLEEMRATTQEVIDDPDNLLNPVEIWWGLVKEALSAAKTDGVYDEVSSLLIAAFGEESALVDSIDATETEIATLQALLNALVADYNTTVTTRFVTYGTPTDPRLLDFREGDQGTITVTTTSSGGGGSTNKRDALGGAAYANEPTLIGERGAELFVPFTNGTIIPNSRLGGNTSTTTIYIERVETDDLPGDISVGLAEASIVEQVDLIGAF